MDTLGTTVAAATEEVVRLWRSASDRLRPDHGSEDGQGLAEYALILALIAIAVIVALSFLGSSITGTFENVINEGFHTVSSFIDAIINPGG
jgi:pilus assembly protein Flp/PilA